MNNLSCAIVRDLLPLYVDGLVSDETKAAVDEHLEGCPECKAILQDIRPPQEENYDNLKKVDFLKKVRTKGRRRTAITTILGVVITLIGVIMIFCAGATSKSTDIEYRLQVSGNTVTIEMKAASDTQRISRAEFSNSNGMVNVDVYTTPSLFFGNNEKEYSYSIDSDITQVHMGSTVLWEDGRDISNMASSLYQAHNPFVGDMPSNMQIAGILGVHEQFGSFSNELKTDSTPYGWTLILEETVSSSKEDLSIELMRADSCVFLALIDNLDYVIWEYPTEHGAATFKYTAQEATAFCGKDIKQFADSVSDTQELLSMLGIN